MDEDELSNQLIRAGKITGMIMVGSDPLAIREAVKDIDPGMLQAFLDSKPEGFLYTDKVAEVVRLARTLKSFGKG